MGGIFSKSNRPKLPGAYFNWIAQVISQVTPSPGSVVAIPFTSDWGPFKQVTRVGSFAEWQAIYGDSDNTPGYIAVKQAFIGEGLPDRGGAGEVVSYRTGGSAAAKAAHTFQNTAGTPANALTLTAVYEGTRGNNLRITTQTNAADNTKDDLLVYNGTQLLETWTYVKTDIVDLANQINIGSNWVDATELVTGTALGHVTGTALTGGNDGATLLGSDWTALMDALSVENFAVLAPYDLTDPTIVASLKAWVQGQNNAGECCFLVVGGAAGESIATAITRSAALGDPNILTIGVGTVTDDSIGPAGTALDLSTSQLAPRIAGILAARGEFASLTSARLAGVEIKIGATVTQQSQAFDNGILVLTRDSNVLAPVKILAGLSTWKQSDATADPTRPYLIYRQPKYVATMHGFETDMTLWAESEAVGQGSINDDKRAAVVAEARDNLTQRAALGSIQEGFTVQIDQNPPPTPEDEFIALAIDMKFGRSLEQIYFTVTVG